MNKNLTKAHTKNERLETPTGRVGVPPEVSYEAFTVLSDKVIIIADKPTAMRMLGRCRDKGSLPS